jgi:hypothetical protein
MMNDDFYLHTDIPPGMTMEEYRRSRPRGPKAFRGVPTVGFAGSRRSSSEEKDAEQAGFAGHRRAGTSP